MQKKRTRKPPKHNKQKKQNKTNKQTNKTKTKTKQTNKQTKTHKKHTYIHIFFCNKSLLYKLFQPDIVVKCFSATQSENSELD